MALQLIANNALAEDLSLISSIQIRWLTTASDSSSGGGGRGSMLPASVCTCTHMHTHN